MSEDSWVFAHVFWMVSQAIVVVVVVVAAAAAAAAAGEARLAACIPALPRSSEYRSG